MSLWSVLSGKDGREWKAKLAERDAEIEAERDRIDGGGRYTTRYRGLNVKCLTCGAQVSTDSMDLHADWHSGASPSRTRTGT